MNTDPTSTTIHNDPGSVESPPKIKIKAWVQPPPNIKATDKVLILDANQRSALAATRSLGSKGIYVIVADETARTLAGSSKYCRETFVYPCPSKYPQSLIGAVKKECAEKGVNVLFPMADITTSLLLRARDELNNVSIPFGSFDAFEMLTDKWKLFELAQELDIPIPTTHFISSHRELNRLYPQLKFPVVLKPHRSRIWSDGRWIAARVVYANSIQETERNVANHEYFNRHPFVVQECVRGQGQGVFALYDQSKPVVFFAHRRLRENPPSGGVSSLSESIELDPRMCELAQRILDYVKWHGVVMVEFKVSSDKTPYLMEVNARFWGSLQLAIDAGMDFPWLLYQLATGKKPDVPNGYAVGIRSRWLHGDIAHLYKLWLENEAPPYSSHIKKWQALLSFVHFFERYTKYEVNRWEDLKPFFFEIGRYFWR